MDSLNILIHGTLILLMGAAAISDIRSFIIPNIIVLSILLLGFINLIVTEGKGIGYGLSGLIGIGLLFFAIHYLTKGAIGIGDVKLLAAIGLFLGFWNTIGVLLLASLLSGLGCIFLIVLGRLKRDSRVPFAPFIFIGGSIYIVLLELGLMVKGGA